MFRLAQHDALRSEYERNFFMANRPTLSTTQLGSFGSLQIPLLHELHQTHDLLCASRESSKIFLVFASRQGAIGSINVAAEQGIKLEAAPSPYVWDHRHGINTPRLPTERFYFVPFLDVSSPLASYGQADEYIHLSWEHNLAWYMVTKQLRFPTRGFFCLPRIQRNIEKFLSGENLGSLQVASEPGYLQTGSTLEKPDEGDDEFGAIATREQVHDGSGEDVDHQGDQGEAGEEDLTLINTESDLMFSDRLSHNPPSPKRDPPSPPLRPASAPKRPRSTSPCSNVRQPESLSIGFPVADVPARSASTIPSIAVSPPVLERPSSTPLPASTSTVSTTAAQSVLPISLSSLPFSSTSTISASPNVKPRSVAASGLVNTNSRPYPSQSVLLDRKTYLPVTSSDKLRAIRSKGEVHTCLRVPRFASRKIIGERGAKIASIQKQTQVFLQIEDALTPMNSIVHFAGGSLQQRQDALTLVVDIVKKEANWFVLEKNLVALT